MQAVMMVAGKSTRTCPLTLTRPKPLLPVLNKPLIYFNLDQLAGLVDEVILITGYRKESIGDLLGNSYRGMRIVYREQKEQLGTGHAVLQAAPHIRGPFIVMNGDDLFAREDMEMLTNYRFAALALKVPDPSLYGVYNVTETNQVIRLIEKPNEEIGNLANVGCYLFQPSIFPILEKTEPSERGEIEITSAIQTIAKIEPFFVLELNKYWLPTGYPWDLLKTQNYLFDHYFRPESQQVSEQDLTITGNVQIGENTILQRGVEINGPTVIGDHCEIGAGTFIGPYTSIGSGSIIGRGSIIDHSIFLKEVTVGLNNLIRYSVLGEHVSIGEACHFISQHPGRKKITSKVKGKQVDVQLPNLGTIAADHAEIGAHTIIYPGCKIMPTKVIPIVSKIEQDV